MALTPGERKGPKVPPVPLGRSSGEHPRQASAPRRAGNGQPMSDTMWIDALRMIYVASCLSCRRLAVRIGLDGKPVCDWCRITIQEARQRILLERLLGTGE